MLKCLAYRVSIDKKLDKKFDHLKQIFNAAPADHDAL